MPKTILMEQFHVTVHAPGKLKATEYDAIHRTLIGRRFRAALGRAVEEVARRFPSLNKTRFSISR